MDGNFLSARDLCGPVIPVSRAKLHSMVQAGEFPVPLAFGTARAWPRERVVAWLRQQGMRDDEIEVRIPTTSARGKRTAKVAA